MSDDTDNSARLKVLTVLEVLLLAALLVMFFVFPWYLFGTYFCIEDCHGPSQEEIDTYHVYVRVLVVLIVATVLVRWRRGRPFFFGWHTVVILASVGSAVFFQVPEVNWVDVLREDPPPPDHSYSVPCHSGSHDCPGG